MIPKLVHFIWFDKKNPNVQSYPKKMRKYINSWTKHNPTYTFRFWYNQELLELLDDPEFPQGIKKIWKSLKHIEKCDILRYFVLYLYGGIYSDLNVMCYKGLDPLIEGRKIAFVVEPIEAWKAINYQVRVANCILVSSTRHKFWIDLLGDIYRSFPTLSISETDNVLHNTGPTRLTTFINRYFTEKEIKNIFLPQCQVLPYTYQGGLSMMCKNDRSKYLAKIWRDTSNWGNTISPGNRRVIEYFTKMTNFYQPDAIFPCIVKYLLWMTIAVLIIILATVIIKIFIIRRKYCKIKN